jgi:hypothetical protein
LKFPSKLQAKESAPFTLNRNKKVCYELKTRWRTEFHMKLSTPSVMCGAD